MKNIVITGGTSGFGAVATRKLVHLGGKVYAGYRKKPVNGAENIPLDMESLKSVKSFADTVIQKLNGAKLQAIVCNAGVSYPTLENRTEDSFETTFAVNHLAHYYLIRLLMPYLSENARIILTTSGTIDPNVKTVAVPPKHANVFWLAHPENDKTIIDLHKVNPYQAYASSKLCNLMTAIKINKLPQTRENNWQGIGYDPGVTPGTGLNRNRGQIFRILWLIFAIPFIRKTFWPKSNSISDAGNTLADIALGRVTVPLGKYPALRAGEITFIDPPGLAHDQELTDEVWIGSEEILKDKLEEKLLN